MFIVCCFKSAFETRFEIEMAISQPLTNLAGPNTFFGKLQLTRSENLFTDMNFEVARLLTFKFNESEYPLSCSPLTMAKSGFFQSGHGEVTCFSCRKMRGDWQEREDPRSEHLRLSPNCNFINGRDTFNVPIFVPVESVYVNICRLLHTEFCPPGTPVPQLPSLLTEQPREEPATPSALPRASFQVESEPGPSALLVSDRLAVESGDSAPNNVISNAAATFGDQPRPIVEQMFNYRSEQRRLDSFQDWPSTAQVSPEELARAGFFYTGEGDRVQCPFCRGILRNWDADDLPLAEHSRHFPNCPFIRGSNVGNIALPAPSRPARPTSAVRQQITDAMLGIVTDRPRIPQFAIEATRLNSFLNWPQHKSQTPQQLARAGFFYAGYGDNVKCFYCDGGLRNWERGDDPWEEHARWFPRCPYVRQVKGEAYIASVQQQSEQGSENEDEELQTNQEGAPAPASGEPRRVERREIIMRLDRPMIKTILDMGFSRNKVIRVLEKRLQETGDDFDTPDALLDALFNEPDQPDDNAQRPPPPPSNSQPPPSEGSTPAPAPAPTSTDMSQIDAAADGGQNRDTQAEEARGDSPMSMSGPQSAKDGDPQQLVEENRQLREQRMCKVCMDEDVCVVFLPCGHLVCCATCAPAMNKCPICRTHVRGTVRTYMS